MMSPTAPFRSYDTTEEQSYASGYETGVNWNVNWDYVPGGPWVCRDNPFQSKDPAWTAYCKQTALNNAAWKRGWCDGRASVLNTTAA